MKSLSDYGVSIHVSDEQTYALEREGSSEPDINSTLFDEQTHILERVGLSELGIEPNERTYTLEWEEYDQNGHQSPDNW